MTIHRLRQLRIHFIDGHNIGHAPHQDNGTETSCIRREESSDGNHNAVQAANDCCGE